MAKSNRVSVTIVPSIVRVPNVRIAKGVFQVVKFRITKRGVVCSTKNQPKILVRVNHGLGGKDRFEAQAKNGVQVFMARTPAKAFARAAKFYWSTNV